MGAPNIASKRWVWEQYDTHVRTNTVVGPGPSDAAVIRIKPRPGDAGPQRGLAMKTDCNGRYVYLNPRRGAQIAVAEAARNVVCAGGAPLAVTNCLNFGNPYKPEVYWTFTEAVGGMGDACRAFETPVTGGNVSFYNESPDGEGGVRAVFPTPTIGMVGLVENVTTQATRAAFSPGDALAARLAGRLERDRRHRGVGVPRHAHGRTAGDAPHLDLDEERAIQAAVLAAIRGGLVRSAHDCADGGLAVALAEGCLWGETGASVDLPASGAPTPPCSARPRAASSWPSRPRTPRPSPRVCRARRAGDPLGTCRGDELTVSVGGTPTLEVGVAALARRYERAIPDAMEAPVAA